MTNWLVTLINMHHPFDEKKVLVHADTIVEAFDETKHGFSNHWPRSAQFHSVGTDQPAVYHHHLVEVSN